MNRNVLYGTPTKRPHHRPTKSPSDAERPPKPPRSLRLPSGAEEELAATWVSMTSPTSTGARHSVDRRLESALEDREEELRDLRQTMELNEKALLWSLDDERRRWAAERQRLEAELLFARRHSLPASRHSFHAPSCDQHQTGDCIQTAAVVVVEPTQRQPSGTVSSVDARSNKLEASCFPSTTAGSTMSSTETSVPDEIGSGNVCSTTDLEMGRHSSGVEVDVGGDGAEKLRLKLEHCQQEFANEKRRWADEKRAVIAYQLRLQTYCRQLTVRNQLLEDQMKAMSAELGRNSGSSGYSTGSDSAGLVVQFIDDSNLLTSSL